MLGWLLSPIGAAEMAAQEHAEAVRSLARGDATVVNNKGQFFWRVPATVAPDLPAGKWYLYFGSGEVPTELLAFVTQTDGPPANKRRPKTNELLSYVSTQQHSVLVQWQNHARNLLTPALKAIVPRGRVLHGRWDSESATILLLEAPTSCTGSGYPATRPEASTTQRPMPLPQLLLLESAAIVGLLPATGVREALLETIETLDADTPALAVGPPGQKLFVWHSTHALLW